VRTALLLSYRQLSRSARQTFRRLAVIPGATFSAEVVSVLSGATLAFAEEILDELVELGLVLAVADDRYGLHDLVRSFAGTRLSEDEPDQRPVLRDRLVGWLLAVTIEAGRHFEPVTAPGGPADGMPRFDGPEAAAKWLDDDVVNWFPALRMAAQGDRRELVIEVAESMHWFSDRRLHLGIWHEVFALAARAALEIGDVRQEAVHLNYLAWAQGKCLGDFQSAAATAASAFARATAAEDVSEQAWASHYAANAHLNLGQLDAALRYKLKAVALFREAGDHGGLPQAMAGLGDIQLAMGRPAEALRTHRETLSLTDDPRSPMARPVRDLTAARTRQRIGLDLTALGRWDEAVLSLRQALDGMRRNRTVGYEGTVNLALATPLLRLGEIGQARACLARAAEIAVLSEDPDLARQSRSALAALEAALIETAEPWMSMTEGQLVESAVVTLR
jgi:tetratricopeptide (TPR) repeat protein